MSTKLDKYVHRTIKEACEELRKETEKCIDNYSARKLDKDTLIVCYFATVGNYLTKISIANECLGKALEDEESTGNSERSKLLS